MIQSPMSRLQGQKGMEKTMVVMVFLLLLGLGQAAGLSCKEDKECRRNVCIDLSCAPRSTAGGHCNTNSHCFSSTNVCINKACSVKSPAGGACDTNDSSDCAVPSSTCSANNICLSPTNGQCSQNDQCALSSDSCIGLKCKAKGAAGGTCDANDNADCAVPSSTCSANNICLSPTNGQCSQNDQCALSSDSCIGLLCKAKSAPGGPCDTNDNPDCAVSSSTCSANNICLSPSDGQCSQNDQCALSSDSCIGQVCSVKSAPGGTCDTSDSFDCAVSSSTCSANNICLSPTNGQCSQNDQCALSSDSCIGLLCKAKGAAGGTCDTNDNADCASGYNCVGTSCAFDLSSFQWEGIKSMSNLKNYAASVAVGGFLFVFGGRLFSLSNTVEMYNPQTNTWVPKANIPVVVWKHSVVAVGDFVYLIGGADVSNYGKTYFFRYDTVNDMWSTVTDFVQLPSGLHSMAAAAYGTTIFAFGGQSGSGTGTATNNIYTFDIANPGIGWTTLSNILPIALTQASAVTVGTDIYITGGANTLTKTYKFDATASPLVAPQDLSLPLTASRIYHASFFNSNTNKIHLVGGVASADKAKTVETLDLNASSMAWSLESSASLNMINTASSGGLIGSRFYLPGAASTNSASYSSVMYVLDVSGPPEWVPFSASPSPSFLLAVGKVGPSILTAGGFNQDTVSIASTSQYDIPSDSWTSLPDLPVTLSEMGSAAVGNEFFTIGGAAGGARTAITYSIIPGQGSWSTRANMNVARSRLCAASQGTKIYAYGGVGALGIVDTMEIYETDPAQTATYNKWRDVTASSKVPFSPTAVNYCAAVNTGTKILIFGGVSPGGVSGKIQSFDIATEKWDDPASFPTITARYYLSAAFLNGLVIVTGGFDGGTTPLATVEAFDVNAKTVSSLPDMPSPRLGHGSVTDGNSVFVVGGQNGGLVAPLEKYRLFP